uniref:DUF630 domain-containing protein n=1 Tax=Oryza nivara TaxID=4536 RepID=A0A0E0FF05_ORYNI
MHAQASRRWGGGRRGEEARRAAGGGAAPPARGRGAAAAWGWRGRRAVPGPRLLLAHAIRHRYALADAHRAYAASLRDAAAAAALHDFLRGVQVLPSSSTCSTGRGTTAERSPSSGRGRRSVAARAAS